MNTRTAKMTITLLNTGIVTRQNWFANDRPFWLKRYGRKLLMNVGNTACIRRVGIDVVRGGGP
jgi:hypothetical protein